MQLIVIHGSNIIRTEDLRQRVEKVSLDYLSTDVINKCLQRDLIVSVLRPEDVQLFDSLVIS